MYRNLHKNSKQLIAIYLHKQGRSARYIASKLGVTHPTISSWLNDADSIRQVANERLSERLYTYLLIDKGIDWYSEDE